MLCVGKGGLQLEHLIGTDLGPVKQMGGRMGKKNRFFSFFLAGMADGEEGPEVCARNFHQTSPG